MYNVNLNYNFNNYESIVVRIWSVLVIYIIIRIMCYDNISYVLAPEITGLVYTVIAMFMCILWNKNSKPIRIYFLIMNFIKLFWISLFFISVYHFIDIQNYDYILVLDGRYSLTFTSQLIKVFISFFGALFFIFNELSFEFYTFWHRDNSMLTSLMVYLCYILSSITNLIDIFIIFEIIFLIILNNVAAFNSEINHYIKPAAILVLKWYIFNAVMSCIFFVFTLLIYTQFYTTDINLITNKLLKNKLFGFEIILFNISLALLLIFFFFKIGIFPLHFYVAESFEFFNPLLVFFITSIQKPIYLFIFWKILLWIKFSSYYYIWIFIFIGILSTSVLVGTVQAYNTLNIKKFFGFMSISLYSFLILLSLSFDKKIYFLIILYLFFYVLANSFWFAFLITFHNYEIVYFNDIKFNNSAFIIKYILSFSLLILSGLPPLILFFIKYLILINLVLFKFKLLIIFISFYNIFNAYLFFNIINKIMSTNLNNLNSLNTVNYSNEVYKLKIQRLNRIFIILFIIFIFLNAFFLLY